jgi:hypothetical protein
MGKKQRDCPALGMSIPSARCGAERGVVIACPEECDFNPFGRQNYDQLGEIEDRVIEKLMRRFMEMRGFAACERLARTADRHGEDLFLAHWEFAKAYHHDRDTAGQTLTEQWEASGFDGLNNDEKQVVRWMAATRLCLIEIHRQSTRTRSRSLISSMPILNPSCLWTDHWRDGGGGLRRF